MTILKRQYLQKVRTDNYLKILKLLSLADTASRTELASASGLSQMTVSRITKKLLENQICFETHPGDGPNKLGRKTVGLSPIKVPMLPAPRITNFILSLMSNFQDKYRLLHPHNQCTSWIADYPAV